jgi:hypothetical protein
MLSNQNTRHFPAARKNHIERNVTSPGSFSSINTPINCLRAVSKERNVRANVVGIFMSTSTGNTDQAAECIRKHLVSRSVNHANLIHPTSTTRADMLHPRVYPDITERRNQRCIRCWRYPGQGHENLCYTFDRSGAVRDDKFLGFLLDEDNEFDYSEGRVKGWTKQLINEGLQ